MVNDQERANHCKGANSSSIGIEHVASETQTLAQAQSKAAADLIRWLLQQYDIPSNRVFGHDFAPGYSGGGTSCPDALYGDHTQQAVQDWVNANVLTESEKVIAEPASQPAPGSKLVVTASALNVRMTPSLQGTIVGSLKRDTQVDWLETSSDQYWAKVQTDEVTGWASRRYLVLPSIKPTKQDSDHAKILALATTSAIARYRWLGRGIAPIGYIKGMALVYARLYCKFKAGDPATIEMAKANSGDGTRDALAHFASQFEQVGMDNEASGVATLRHLVVLLVGLGMRESSGRYCEGRDRSATNTTATTAEAGLFQASYNARQAHPLMTELFQSYRRDFKADPAMGFVDVFKEGVNCKASDWENCGSGDGKEFQELSKKCPAFAAEFCALGLRSIRRHWGPINTRMAEIRPECNQLLMRIEQVIELDDIKMV